MGAERLTTAVRRAALALSASALVAAGCDAPTTARALEFPEDFDPRLQAGGRKIVYHWPLGRTIRLYLSTNPSEDAEALEAFHSESRVAAALWREAIYYREFDFAFVGDPAHADVVLRTVSQPSVNVLPSGCGDDFALFGFGGRTTFCAAAPTRPDRVVGDTLLALPLAATGGGNVKFEVVVDPSRATSRQHLASIVAHELGHVLGLGDHSLRGPSEPQDLMSPGAAVPAPTERDLAALRYILHQPAELRP